MILYHGSNIEIDAIDLDKCRPCKDFGKGFYTSPVLEQAWIMAKRTVRIHKKGSPCVTALINNRNRKFRDIQSPDCNTDNKYDIVIGPVANDDIAALIDVFLAGLISDDALAKELAFRDLSAQVSFHTEKSIAGLRKKEAYHG